VRHSWSVQVAARTLVLNGVFELWKIKGSPLLLSIVLTFSRCIILLLLLLNGVPSPLEEQRKCNYVSMTFVSLRYL
jgi:hypothetical protein